jgi:translation initiation factor IF-2
MAEGWVIESSIKQVGKSAVVLVKRGTLRAGDIIVAGTSWARIRLLRNEAGQEIQEAPPGTPAEVVGWNDTLPDAGDELIQAPDEGKARAAILYRLEMQEREQNIDEAARQEQRRQEEDASRKATSDSQRVSDASSSVPESHQQASTPESGTKLLNFIVKSDVAGSAEAVSGAILQLGNHEVQPRILRSGAGAITEWDIEHASISGSTIVSFNIATTPPIRNLAQREGVTIIEHTIIYRLSDEIKAMLSSHLADKVTYRVTGEAEVLEIFPINVRGRLFYNIAGCRVRNGAVSAGSMARVLRKGDTAFEGKIESMRHGKKSVDQMFKGSECGIALSKYQGYETGDIIQTFEEVREARHL